MNNDRATLAAVKERVDETFILLNAYAADPYNMGGDARKQASISPHAVLAEVYATLAPASGLLTEALAPRSGSEVETEDEEYETWDDEPYQTLMQFLDERREIDNDPEEDEDEDEPSPVVQDTATPNRKDTLWAAEMDATLKAIETIAEAENADEWGEVRRFATEARDMLLEHSPGPIQAGWSLEELTEYRKQAEVLIRELEAENDRPISGEMK